MHIFPERNRYGDRKCRLRYEQRSPADEMEAWLAGLIYCDGTFAVERGEPRAITLPQSTEKAWQPFLKVSQRYDRKPSRVVGVSNYGPFDRLQFQFRNLPLWWKTHVQEIADAELERHYWRGMVDGDGCVVYDKRGYYRVEFYWEKCKPEAGVAWNRILRNHALLPYRLSTGSEKLLGSGVQHGAKKFLEWLYDPSELFLPHKKNRALERMEVKV